MSLHYLRHNCIKRAQVTLIATSTMIGSTLSILSIVAPPSLNNALFAKGGTYEAHMKQRRGPWSMGSLRNCRVLSESMRPITPPTALRIVVPAVLACIAVSTGVGESGTGGDVDLRQYQWQKRLLLVFAPTREEPHFQALHESLGARTSEVEDRDLVVFEVLETGPSTVDGDPLDPKAARVLRERFRAPVAAFSVVLVGKDGEVKLERQERTNLDEIFALIDSMPMRKREMRRDNP